MTRQTFSFDMEIPWPESLTLETLDFEDTKYWVLQIPLHDLRKPDVGKGVTAVATSLREEVGLTCIDDFVAEHPADGSTVFCQVFMAEGGEGSE